MKWSDNSKIFDHKNVWHVVLRLNGLSWKFHQDDESILLRNRYKTNVECVINNTTFIK
jgi:hypothetical protein